MERIAECVGLWLADGDKKSLGEVAFTNNEITLIKYFHVELTKIYNGKNSPRIYIYSNERNKLDIPNFVDNIKFYNDKRANKPYFIYRLADRKFVRYWKTIVDEITTNKKLFPDILRGFFAGDGNVKYNKKCISRVVRIAQGKRNDLIEEILSDLKIDFSYSKNSRSYNISGRRNLEIINKLNISKLHPDKDRKFNEMMEEYKQEHYKRGYLKEELYNNLYQPKTTMELSLDFNRSFSRISKVLQKLKKENKVNNFRVRSKDYWTKDDNLIILSKENYRVLKTIDSPKKVYNILKEVGINRKSIIKHLKKLERLKLALEENNIWVRKKTQKRLVIL